MQAEHRTALICALASMALGVLASLAMIHHLAWALALGPAHAICVFACCTLARKEPAAWTFTIAAIIFPAWGAAVAIAGVAIAQILGGVWGMLLPLTIALASGLWLLGMNAAIENSRIFLLGIPGLLGTTIPATVFDSPFMFDLIWYSPALWHLLTPPAILLAAHQTRRREDQWRVQLTCAQCGYPLRNLPGPLCPECGVLIPAGAKDGRA